MDTVLPRLILPATLDELEREHILRVWIRAEETGDRPELRSSRTLYQSCASHEGRRGLEKRPWRLTKWE